MNEFDEIIQQKAHEHASTVPTDAWDNIQGRKKKRRLFFWWFPAALILLGAGYWLLNAHLHGRNKNTRVSLAKGNHAHAGSTENVMANSTGSTFSNEKGTLKNGIPQSKKIVAPITGPDKFTATATKPRDVNMTKNDISLTENQVNVGEKQSATKLTVESSIPLRDGQDSPMFKKSRHHLPPSSVPYAKPIRNKKKGHENGKTKMNVITPDTGTDEWTVAETDLDTALATRAIVPAEIIKHPYIIPNNHLLQLASKDLPLIAQNPTNEVVNIATSKKKNPGDLSKKKNWFVEWRVTPSFPVNEHNEAAVLKRNYSIANLATSFTSSVASSRLEPSAFIGLMLKRRIGKRIQLGAGIEYVKMYEKITISGIETRTQFSYINTLVDGPGGPALVPDTVYAISQGTRTIRAMNNYQWATIPVFIQLNLVQKPKWLFGLTGGAEFLIFSAYRNEINKAGPGELTANPVTTKKSGMLAGFQTGLRLEKLLTRSLSVTVSPIVKWNFSPGSTNDRLFNKSSHFAGLAMGIQYSIK